MEKSLSKSILKENKSSTNVRSKQKAQKNLSVTKGDVKSVCDKVHECFENQTNTELKDEETTVDLSSPGLCSALQLANEIQAASVANLKVEELKLFQQKQLNEAIKHKVTKKSNVPFTKHIFKDLIDLHICDEDIPSAKNPSLKNVNFNTNKDPVFRLQDFYKPDFSTEMEVKIPKQKFEFQKVDYYNGFELYERLESLKNLVKQ